MNTEIMFKDLAVKISNLLNTYNNYGSLHYYWLSSYYAEELIKLCFNDNYSLPINIEDLAKKLGLTIRDRALNTFAPDKFLTKDTSQLVIRKDSYTGEVEKTIYIDTSANIQARRNDIARQIAYYLMYYGADRHDELYHIYSVMPMCPMNSIELAIDIFSAFLLIPISQFFKVFTDYTNYRFYSENMPIATDEWIEFLSNKVGLSSYYTSCAYQYLRNAAYWIYAAYYLYDISMSDDDRRIIKKTTPYFKMEKYDKLF